MLVKIRLLFTVLLFTFSVAALAQTDTISCKRGNWPTMFKKDGQNIGSIKKLQKIVKNDAAAAAQIRKAKEIIFVGAAFGAAGAFIIGNELGSAGSRNTGIRPIPIALGAGLVGVYIPLFISGRHKMREGVKIYNRHVKEGVSSSP